MEYKEDKLTETIIQCIIRLQTNRKKSKKYPLISSIPHPPSYT